MVKKSAAQKVLDALLRGESLTIELARKKYKCGNPSGRIEELRKRGHNIQARMIKVPTAKRYVTEYFMEVE